MSIQCPYCLHLMDLKGAAPGRFGPKCPSCKLKFVLVIHKDPAEAPTVAALPPSRREALSADIEDALGIERTPPPARKEKVRRVQVTGPGDTAAPPSGNGHSKGNGLGAGATVAPPGGLADSVAGTAPPPGATNRLTQPAVDPTVERQIGETLPPPGGDSDGSVAGTPMPTVRPSDRLTAAQTAPPDRAVTVAVTEAGSGAATLPASAPGAAPADDEDVTGRLGGYEIVYRLGRGGMGAVYLARQLSLDRNVALKTLLKALAADAQFVARFTREAYAAAQLVHHNVVQIYDIGAQKLTHFFSMEFVEGQNLGNLVREHGRLDPQTAVGYVLQAARGLKFAHEHGMVHRDIKPENLMLNRHGIVKVADLGLVKVPGTKESEAARAKKAAETGRWYDTGVDATDLNVSMGTPAYMPPEQAKDAAHVDQRADIYSLGCTLYALVVGDVPFRGATAEETIQKHVRDPFPAPEDRNDAVGPMLSHIIQRMCAKRPEDRYQNMGEVIEALEGILGVESTGDFVPREEQGRDLENCVRWFNDVKLVGVRSKLIAAFFPVCAVAILAVLVMKLPLPTKIHWGGGLLGLAVLTPVFYLLVQGASQKTYLFAKLREFAFGAGVVGWLIGLAIAGLSVAILVTLDLHWYWLGFAVAALVLAAGFHYAIDPAIARDRKGALDSIENQLKQFRRTGVSEPAVQQFVCKFAGENWEEIYETLFGYESKMVAREKWGKVSAIGRTGVGDRGQPRPTFAAWRDPVIAWIDEKQKARREARERRHIEQVEMQSLRAKGFGESAAKKKARRNAESIVIKAAELRDEAREKLLEVAPTKVETPDETKKPDEQPQEPQKHESPLSEDALERRKKKAPGVEEGLEGWEHLSYFQRRYGGWQGFFLGPIVRFAFGAILLFGGLLWAHQNALFEAKTAKSMFEVTVDQTLIGSQSGAAAAEAQAQAQAPLVHTDRPSKPLELAGVPARVTTVFDHWAVPLAGILLMISSIFQGTNLGLFLVPSALLMVLGAHLGVPAAGPLSSHGVAAVFGLLGAVTGFVVARK